MEKSIDVQKNIITNQSISPNRSAESIALPSDTAAIKSLQKQPSISSICILNDDILSTPASGTAAPSELYSRSHGKLLSTMPHTIESSVTIASASGIVNGVCGKIIGGGDGCDVVTDGLDDPETIKSIKRKLCLVRTDHNAEIVPSESCDEVDDSNVLAPAQTTTPTDLTVSNNDFVDTNLRSTSDTADGDNSNSSNDKCTRSSNSFLIKQPDSLMLVGGASGGKTLNDEDELQPLLFGRENERRKVPVRGIVKSPSAKSFITDGAAAADAPERPVLHVQFRHSGSVPPSYGSGRDAEGNCSSPASSVSSTSSSSSDDEDSSSGQYSEAKPPDGGWGWVVVFASFVVNLIADGITFSFGVIYVEFLNYFGEGKGKTAWIGSLFMAMPLLSGPVASFLTDRYGCRKVTIAGSILACLGFVMSAFSTSMEMLFLTFGVLAGFGLSLCYVAAVVIVAYYFDKRRSFATGLSVCGSGIGTFIFAPLTQVLIENYGWRGTTLILAGFFLNMTVCGMLMRDLEWTTHKAKLRAKSRKQNKLGVSAESFSVSNSTYTGGTANNLHQQPLLENDLGIGNIDPTLNPRLFSSLITLPTFMRNGEKVSIWLTRIQP